MDKLLAVALIFMFLSAVRGGMEPAAEPIRYNSHSANPVYTPPCNDINPHCTLD